VSQTSLNCFRGNEVKVTKSFIVTERSNYIVMHILPVGELDEEGTGEDGSLCLVFCSELPIKR